MQRPALFVPLAERNFRLFLLGHALASTSVWMQKLAQAWLVLVLTDSGLLLGLTVACQQLPTLLFVAQAGVLADRLDKRRLVMLTAVLGAIPPLSIGLVQHLGAVTTWMVLAAACVQGCVDTIDRPTRMTLINDVAPVDGLSNSVSLSNITQEVGKLVGPAVAGFLIGVLGLPNVFLVNGGMYLLVFASLVLIRLPARVVGAATVRVRGNFSGTLRYVARKPELAVGLGLMAVSGLFAYNFNVLVTLMIRNVLGGSATQAGLGFTSLGLGGIVGGLVLAGAITMTSRSQVVVAACFASLFAGVALASTLTLVYSLLFGVGALSVTFRSNTASLLQLGSEPHMRGRVISLYYLALMGTSPIGGPLQGWLSELTSARFGFLLGGGATALAAFVGWRYLIAHGAWGGGLPEIPQEPGDSSQ